MTNPDWYAAATAARGVAVIGASTRPEANHYQNHLATYGFTGQIYPVHPTANEIQGLRAYRSVKDIDGPVDMAVVMIAAAGVPAVVSECREAGIPLVYVGSAGFAELGVEGAELQAEMLAAAGGTTRILGPNGNGVANVANGQVAAALDSVRPPLSALRDHGVAVVSQSGIVAASTFLAAQRRGIGVGKYFSVGNEADLGIPEILSRLVDDPDVQVILCYVEGLRDASGFLAAARRAREAGKHVVVLKSGVSELGAKAAASHTASIAGEDRVYDHVLNQYGVIRASSIEQLVDIAGLLVRANIAGNRVLVLSISGAQGVMATDLLSAHGLELGEWDPALRVSLASELPTYLNVNNPFDGGGPMVRDPAALESILRAAERAEGFDLILICSCALPDTEFELTGRIIELTRDFSTPIALVWQSGVGASVARCDEAGAAAFEQMDRAIAAAGAIVAARPDKQSLGTSPDANGAGASIDIELETLIGDQAGALDEVASKAVLARAGIPVVAEVVCDDRESAVVAAGVVGYPLVAKLRSSELQHKTEAKAVSLGITDEETLAREVDRLLGIGVTLGLSGADVVVQRQIDIGLELLLGMHTDPTFGRVVTIGLGGVLAEALDDVAIMDPTATEADIVIALRRLSHQKLLTGYRGMPALSDDQIVPVIENFCRLVTALPSRVTEVDVNPLVLTMDGKEIVAVDALIVLGETPDPESGRR